MSVSLRAKALEALVGVFFVFATAAYWIFERDKAIDFVSSMMCASTASKPVRTPGS